MGGEGFCRTNKKYGCYGPVPSYNRLRVIKQRCTTGTMSPQYDLSDRKAKGKAGDMFKIINIKTVCSRILKGAASLCPRDFCPMMFQRLMQI